jgi:hypothetical protein
VEIKNPNGPKTLQNQQKTQHRNPIDHERPQTHRTQTINRNDPGNKIKNTLSLLQHCSIPLEPHHGKTVPTSRIKGKTRTLGVYLGLLFAILSKLAQKNEKNTKQYRKRRNGKEQQQKNCTHHTVRMWTTLQTTQNQINTHRNRTYQQDLRLNQTHPQVKCPHVSHQRIQEK